MAPISPQSKTAVPIVFGAMTIGNGVEQSRVRDIHEAEQLLDIFQSHGHNEVDTSRIYGSGTSEEYLGKIRWQQRDIIMDTKLYPTARRGFDVPGDQVTHEPEDLRKFLRKSLEALKTDKVDMWYLHGELWWLFQLILGSTVLTCFPQPQIGQSHLSTLYAK